MIGSRGPSFILAVALLAGLAGQAAAQDTRPQPPDSPAATPGQRPSDGETPPVAVGPGWKYEKRAADVHMFLCEQPRCTPQSRVSYRLYAQNNAMNLEQFRRGQETVVKALQERAPPG